MRILHVCAIGATAQGLLLPQIDYFLARGLEVEIACSPDSTVECLQNQGYLVYPVQINRKISPILNLNSILKLAQLMRQRRYDLVHVHTPIAAVLGRIAAKLAGIPRIVYTAHGFPFHDRSSPNQYRFYFTVEKLSALITNLILTQNREDVETACNLRLCSPEKVKYLGNGIDMDRFRRDHLIADHQTQLRRALGIPDTANLIIGTIGRLTRTKGSEYLIDSTAQLVSKFPNLHTLIIGYVSSGDPEPIEAKLIEKIHTLGLENNVTLTGQRNDIRELLGLLDVFILPTFAHEGLPRSILEAMGMALPVVTTQIRGCREAVIHNETGVIVPPQDSQQLAKALETLLSNDALRQAYGKAGRQRLEVEYDERLVFDRLASYYQELGIVFPTIQI